ncbi:MAG: CDP-glycerol glycerophosphotransferase family protein [Propioniciclava sp.]
MGPTDVVGAASARIRSAGGALIRRLHLLPGGVPDGIGEDARLDGVILTSKVVVFFPDTPDSLYQLADWYVTLEAVDREFGVTVICMDSRTGRRIREDSNLAVIVVGRDATIDELLARSDVHVCLYVNHAQQNLLMLRANRVVHVALQHGDSDKAVSISNQIKAYDFAFMAGQAAVDRLSRHLMFYDAEAKCIIVGYPEPPPLALPEGIPPANGKRVLYAPTWEGGHPSVGYSSVLSHGLIMVQSLIEAGYEVVYRPHPLTGVRLAEFREQDGILRARLAAAEGSRVSTGIPLAVDLQTCDILITDVSAVANHWLRTGKPMIVTEMCGAAAQPAGMGLLEVVPRIGPADAADIATVVERELVDDPSGARRRAVAEYYLSPGSATDKTIRALRDLMTRRAAESSRLADDSR